MKAKSESVESGYTLIEVLVAFTLLAMTLTVLLRSFASGTRNIEIASEYTQAVLLAEAQLAAVSHSSAPLANGWLEHHTEDYVVSLSVAPVESVSSSRDAIEARRIAVAVAWPGPEETRRIEFSTIRLDEVKHDDGGTGPW